MPFQFESSYLDWPFVPGRAWDLFWPAKVQSPVAVFFIHGGGWHAGTRVHMHRLMEHLTDKGIVTASADYRLAGGGVGIAEQVGDVREAYACFRQRLSRQGGPERVVVYGSSAGGHLALLLALAKPGACGDKLPADAALEPFVHEGVAGVAVQAAPITFEPWPDIMPQIWADMTRVVGESFEDRPDLYRLASPIHHVSAGCPPVFIMDASQECTFPLELNDQFIDALRAVGTRVERELYRGAEHGFLYALSRSFQRQAMADLLTFVRSCA